MKMLERWHAFLRSALLFSILCQKDFLTLIVYMDMHFVTLLWDVA